MDLLIFTTLAFKKAKKKGVIIDMEDLGFAYEKSPKHFDFKLLGKALLQINRRESPCALTMR